jgi:hypothetical protein
MLQAGRSRVRLPMRALHFFNLPNPSSHTMALGTTQPLREMSTRNLPECRGRPVAGSAFAARPTLYSGTFRTRSAVSRTFLECIVIR